MFGLDDIIAEGLKIINKFVPDPNQAAQAQLEMLKIKQADNFKNLEVALQEKQMQADINREEAKSDSRFVAGWRPFVGWVCGVGFSLQVVVFPLLSFVLAMIGHPLTMPEMPIEVLVTTLFGLLGLGGLRTWEKKAGLRNGGS